MWFLIDNLKKLIGIRFVIFNVLLLVYALSVVFYHYETIWTYPHSAIRFGSRDKIDVYDVKHFDAATNHTTSFTTLVTALFHLDKSKHSRTDYETWSRTMLRSLDSSSASLVAFVDLDWSEFTLAEFSRLNLTGFFHTFNIIYFNQTILNKGLSYVLKERCL